MSWAAASGHLHIMKFVYFNRNVKPSIQAIKWASCIEVVDWLNDIRKGSMINLMVWVEEERCCLKGP